MSNRDGVLNINKPSGITSHDVVQHVRRILKEKRIGHTGTLDPMATGVLVLCVGKATRIAHVLEAGEKEYEAVMRLGVITDTLDADGNVIQTRYKNTHKRPRKKGKEETVIYRRIFSSQNKIRLRVSKTLMDYKTSA